jgi:hypothetical protein
MGEVLPSVITISVEKMIADLEEKAVCGKV